MMLITEKEKALARHCVEMAMKEGAGAVRASLSKSMLDSITMRDGKLDKVIHSADRSIFLHIFVDGRYGTFSTNRIEDEGLEDFIRESVATARMFAPDEFRCLPEPSLKAKDALTGTEAGLLDEDYDGMDADLRMEAAMAEVLGADVVLPEGIRILSEETEYGDSIDDNLIVDSEGFEARHVETSFTITSEVTIEDAKGRKFSGFWWEGSPRKAELKRGFAASRALERALAQTGPRSRKGGKMMMVTENGCSSRLVGPILGALQAMSIQQHNSFLEDSLGKELFSPDFSLVDKARETGRPGARFFDTEGVATMERRLIDHGVVTTWFVNSYMSRKMDLPQTVEGVSRPTVEPFLKGLKNEEKEISLSDMLEFCGEGILVTGFNGGNCNSATGDFSYGIDGFAFKNGKITRPVREMVITGNMLTLWKSLVGAGSDARECSRWAIPSLAFENVDFSA